MTNSSPSRVCARIASSIAVAAAPALAQAPSLTGLGVLPGGTESCANGVSADGRTVTGWSRSPAGDRAFRWTSEGGMADLGVLAGGTNSYGNAISGDGQTIAGTSESSQGARAFRWSLAGGLQALEPLPGGASSSGVAISSDGSVVGGGSDSDVVLWARGAATEAIFLHGSSGGKFPTYFAGTLQALSGDGSSATMTLNIVPWDGDATSYACRWTRAGGLQQLAIGRAGAISFDGTALAGTTEGPWWQWFSYAFKWSASSGGATLGALTGAYWSEGRAISGDGAVVGGRAWNPTEYHAFLWTEALGIVDLNSYLPSLGVDLTGWVLTETRGLAADGSVVVGNGSYLGRPRAWIARIPRLGDLVVPVCFGDGTQGPCPCGNTGRTGRGCENSSSTGGARLAGSGQVRLSADTLILTVSGERDAASSLFWQGAQAEARVFGDGVGCMRGPLVRLYSHAAAGGVASAPQGTDLSVSASSAARGDPLRPGSVRVYHVFYRDPDASFCDWPLGSTFNVSNGLRVLWSE